MVKIGELRPSKRKWNKQSGTDGVATCPHLSMIWDYYNDTTIGTLTQQLIFRPVYPGEKAKRYADMDQ